MSSHSDMTNGELRAILTQLADVDTEEDSSGALQEWIDRGFWPPPPGQYMVAATLEMRNPHDPKCPRCRGKGYYVVRRLNLRHLHAGAYACHCRRRRS